MMGELMEKEVHIFIITNADEKWVKNCLTHFLPDLYEFMQENSIKLFSARKLYAKSTPVEKWKVNLF